MVDVCIVIVTINHESFIESCIKSVLESEFFYSLELVVVDDGSVDRTGKILDTYKENLKLIRRSGGHSFSSNNNLVLKNFNAKYFLVLNPDTVLSKSSIAGLYSFMETHPDAAASGPKLIYPDGTLQLSPRRFPNIMSFLIRRTPLRVFYTENERGKRHLMAEWKHDYSSKVDWLLGACVMLRNKALNDVGYFDEGYRLYCEDIDLCFRFWKNGWKVYYNPKAIVIHEHLAKSDKAFISRHSIWHYKSMLRYVMKHGIISGSKRPGTILN